MQIQYSLRYVTQFLFVCACVCGMFSCRYVCVGVCSKIKESQNTSLLEAAQSRRETMQTDVAIPLNKTHTHTHRCPWFERLLLKHLLVSCFPINKPDGLKWLFVRLTNTHRQTVTHLNAHTHLHQVVQLSIHMPYFLSSEREQCHL